MKNQRKFSLIKSFTGIIITLNFLTQAAQAEEVYTSKSSLPEDYFKCQSDNQCIVVQGWCSTFSINKKKIEAYNKIPEEVKGKDSKKCPPGWLPPNPNPVCLKKQCEVISLKP